MVIYQQKIPKKQLLLLLLFHQTAEATAKIPGYDVNCRYFLRKTGGFSSFFRRSAVIVEKFQPKT